MSKRNTLLVLFFGIISSVSPELVELSHSYWFDENFDYIDKSDLESEFCNNEQYVIAITEDYCGMPLQIFLVKNEADVCEVYEQWISNVHFYKVNRDQVKEKLFSKEPSFGLFAPLMLSDYLKIVKNKP